MLRKKNKWSIVVLIVLAILLRPYPSFLSGVSRVFYFDFFVAFLCLALVMFGLMTGARVRSSTVSMILILGFILILPIGFNGTDWSYPFRVLYCVFVVWSIVNIFSMDVESLYQNLLLAVKWSAFPLSVIWAIQIFEPSGLASFLDIFYDDVKRRGLGHRDTRITLSFFNANWAGVVLALVSIAMLWGFLTKRERGRSALIYSALFLTMLISTGSRTAFITLAVGYFTLFLLFSIRAQNIKSVVSAIAAAIGSLLLLTIGFTMLPYSMRYRFEVLFSQRLGDDSVQGRLLAWQAALDRLVESPVIGSGLTNQINHNSFLSWVEAFGFLGVVAFFAMLMVYCKKILWRGLDDWSLISLSSTAAFLFAALTAEFVFTTQVALVYGFFIFGIFSRNEPIHSRARRPRVSGYRNASTGNARTIAHPVSNGMDFTHLIS